MKVQLNVIVVEHVEWFELVNHRVQWLAVAVSRLIR